MSPRITSSSGTLSALSTLFTLSTLAILLLLSSRDATVHSFLFPRPSHPVTSTSISHSPFVACTRRSSPISSSSPSSFSPSSPPSSFSSFSSFAIIKPLQPLQSTAQNEDIAIRPDDTAALQSLFDTYSNEDEVLTWDGLKGIPVIREMLAEGDLLVEELQEIWSAVPKLEQLPQQRLDGEHGVIDFESFVQVYRDVDDLFEDDDEGGDDEGNDDKEIAASTAASTADGAAADDSNESDVEDVEEVEELTRQFQSLTTSNKGEALTASQLRQWEEITTLIQEGMLGEDEFWNIWKTTATNNSKGVEGVPMEEWTMDLTGFLKFNQQLDELFEFDDEISMEEAEEMDDDEDDVDEDGDEDDDEDTVGEVEAATAATTATTAADDADDAPPPPKPVLPVRPVITEDLPPAVLFSQLANDNYLVSKEDLTSRWGELMDMLECGDLTNEEFDVIYDKVKKAPGGGDVLNMLDEEGFVTLFEEIDSLFEDEDDSNDEDDSTIGSTANDTNDTPKAEVAETRELKEELLELIQDIAALSQSENRQPCGLDCTELEQERVLEVLGELEREPYNKAMAPGGMAGEMAGVGNVEKEELAGNWELIYSSSSTLKYNEGLSGLAGGLTKFGGLRQKLVSSKYLSDVEYTEVLLPKLGGDNPLTVKITGDWDLRTETSLFSGKPAKILAVTPNKVCYGPNMMKEDKADHWKSLGPMNLLVLSYLDEDLRVMRGGTSTDTLFVFRRVD